MKTWNWSKLVSGVTRRTNKKYVTYIKATRYVSSDVMWSCKSIEEEGEVQKHVNKHIKMPQVGLRQKKKKPSTDDDK